MNRITGVAVVVAGGVVAMLSVAPLTQATPGWLVALGAAGGLVGPVIACFGVVIIEDACS